VVAKDFLLSKQNQKTLIRQQEKRRKKTTIYVMLSSKYLGKSWNFWTDDCFLKTTFSVSDWFSCDPI
jgi:hypothetical protein